VVILIFPFLIAAYLFCLQAVTPDKRAASVINSKIILFNNSLPENYFSLYGSGFLEKTDFQELKRTLSDMGE
jgi:hypothetical protein